MLVAVRGAGAITRDPFADLIRRNQDEPFSMLNQ